MSEKKETCEKCDGYKVIVKEYERRIAKVEAALRIYVDGSYMPWVAREVLGIREEKKR